MEYREVTVPAGKVFYQNGIKYRTSVSVSARIYPTKEEEESEYELNARKILKKMGIKFEAVFLKNGKHFEDDTESRDIYSITISRNNKSMKIEFGQSLNNSEEGVLSKEFQANGVPYYTTNAAVPPTEYDLLSSITKYNPESFDNFCNEFGYDIDSRKANKIYKSVAKEWLKVSAFFRESELDILRKVQ